MLGFLIKQKGFVSGVYMDYKADTICQIHHLQFGEIPYLKNMI